MAKAITSKFNGVLKLLYFQNTYNINELITVEDTNNIIQKIPNILSL